MQDELLDWLREHIAEFARERDWEQFQTPKNLAMAMSVEASEVLEHFQWLTAEESFLLDADKKKDVGHELADVLAYLVRLADQLDIDLEEAVREKMKLNEEKYPAERVRGSAKKYSDYD